MSAREKLGQAITHQLRERGMADREVSSRVGASVSDVERWKAGALVPDKSQWKRLCGMVARGLWTFAALHTEAAAEQEAERESAVRALRRNGHSTTNGKEVVTNFGDKLVTALATPPVVAVHVPEPAQSAGADRPPGWRSPESRDSRREFVRGILRQRPNITMRGKDGLQDLIRAEFGIGLSDAEVALVRDEIARERAPAVITSSEVAQTATGEVKESDVSAGVELIIGAIPGLQEMTIRVDDQGVASVSYSVRRVQVTTVSSSLTVRR